MADRSLLDILKHLESTHFREISGSRLSAAIPVSERLVNEVVAATLPPNLPVRGVSIRPEAGNRFSVRLTPRASMLPAVTLTLDIERQAELPASPVLVLRMATLPGLFGLAGAALPLDRVLPPGVRLDGDRILVDLRVLAAQRGLADLLEHVRTLRVTTDPGRVLLHLEAAVP